jgi:hypothetical protein
MQFAAEFRFRKRKAQAEPGTTKSLFSGAQKMVDAGQCPTSIKHRLKANAVHLTHGAINSPAPAHGKEGESGQRLQDDLSGLIPWTTFTRINRPGAVSANGHDSEPFSE